MRPHRAKNLKFVFDDVVGQWNEGNLSMEGVTVRGLTLNLPSSAKDCGVIVAFSNKGDKTFTDCHVIDCTIENTDQSLESNLENVGGFIGGYGDSGSASFTSTVTFDRCSVENLKIISKTTTVKFEGENTYSGCEKSIGYDMSGQITVDGDATKK